MNIPLSEAIRESIRLAEQAGLATISVSIPNLRAMIDLIEEMRERVRFIEGGREPHELGTHGEHYVWAVNELTERRAYNKGDIATIIAEQRERAAHYEKRFNALVAKRGAAVKP